MIVARTPYGYPGVPALRGSELEPDAGTTGVDAPGAAQRRHDLQTEPGSLEGIRLDHSHAGASAIVDGAPHPPVVVDLQRDRDWPTRPELNGVGDQLGQHHSQFSQ